MHLKFFSPYIQGKTDSNAGSCNLCKNIQRSQKHHIVECEAPKEIFSRFGNLIYALKPITMTIHEMVFGTIGRETEIDVRNLITFSIRSKIHKNIWIQYAAMEQAIESIVRQAKREIRKNIMQMYHKAVFENNLSKFKDDYKNCQNWSSHYGKMAQFILVILFLYKSPFLFFPNVFLSLDNLTNNVFLKLVILNCFVYIC